MKTRIVAGLTAAALVVVLIYYGAYWMILAACLACAALAYIEYDKLFFPAPSVSRQVRQVALIFFSIVAMHHSTQLGWISLWCASTFLYICYVLEPSKSGDFPKAVHDVSLELMGYWYIVGLFGFLTPIAETGELGRHYLLLLFFLVFGGDTAAYFAGSRWGKHTLARLVSPKKSVEGAVAAGIAAIGMSLLWLTCIARRDLASSFAVKVLLFAPVASALAQFGDLFESVLKRSQSRKDSGSFLPGHGGILDRVDGLALASPMFYFFVIFVLESA